MKLPTVMVVPALAVLDELPTLLVLRTFPGPKKPSPRELTPIEKGEALGGGGAKIAAAEPSVVEEPRWSVPVAEGDDDDALSSPAPLPFDLRGEDRFEDDETVELARGRLFARGPGISLPLER